MREGRPFEPSAAAARTAGHDGYPGPVTRKAPPEPVAKAAKAARIELPGVTVQKAPPAPKTAYALAPPPQPKSMPKPASGNVVPKVPSKVPPVASPMQMQERQDLLDDRLRYIALHGQSTIDIRDDFSIRRPTSRDGGIMDPNSQGSDYDWLDRYSWCVAVASRRPLLSAIDAINVLPDPNTHSGIVYVQTENVMLYFRGWEDWSYDNYGWTRRY